MHPVTPLMAALATPPRVAPTALETTPDSERVRRFQAAEAEDLPPTQIREDLRVEGDARGAHGGMHFCVQVTSQSLQAHVWLQVHCP